MVKIMNEEDNNTEERRLVVPGEKLADGKYRAGTGTYSSGKLIYASKVGLFETRGKYVNVIPIKGPYIPKVGDKVIGKVINTSIVSWKIDINSAYIGSLHARNFLNRSFNPLRDDIRQYIDIGEVVFAEIISFNRTRDPVLSVRNRGLGKLKGGRLIEIIPTKIPRIIGRKGSMINLLKDATNTKFKIGQNGVIWLQANNIENEILVVKLIKKIEKEAHTLGLTDRIKEVIEKEKQKRGN
ncbi:MAG: RNA-binding protein [Candidatus Lokiarchaeota archaeon]|nr:RNA-binding protein [Candidatus Lokiarchaeota archaeon]